MRQSSFRYAFAALNTRFCIRREECGKTGAPQNFGFGQFHVAKKKTVDRRNRTAPIPESRVPPSRAIQKPRSGGSRPGRVSRADAAELERIAEILKERRALAKIVASVLRSAREDRVVKQEKMGSMLGRSRAAISNMEQVITDFALADSVLWVRALDKDPKYLDLIFKRLLFEIREFYEQRDGRRSPTLPG